MTQGHRQHHVLVTGGAGFVGSRLVEMLTRRGHRVRAVDVLPETEARRVVRLDGVEYRQVDLRDQRASRAAVEDITHLVHLAAVRTKASDSSPRLSLEVNVDATYDLFTAAADAGVGRIVFGSSHTVYGAFQDPGAQPFLEADTGATGRGLSMYAATKLAAEAFLEAMTSSGGFDYLSLRLGTIYGPRVSAGSNGEILLNVLRSLDAGTRPQIPWARDARHGLTHVDDVVDAIASALVCRDVNMAINVVGEPVTSEQIYGTLVELYGGSPSEIEWLNRRTRFQVADASRRRSVLGVDTLVPLEEGLAGFIDWYRHAGAIADAKGAAGAPPSSSALG